MTLLAGAIVSNDAGDACQRAHAIAERTNRFGTLTKIPVVESARMALYGLVRMPQLRDRGQPDTEDGIWVLGDANYASRARVDAVRRVLTPGTPMPQEVKGRQLAWRVAPDGDGVEVWTDHLGTLTLFIGRSSEAIYFATDFGAIAAQIGSAHLSLDVEQAYMEIALGSSPSDRTVFREITVAPPGAVIRLDSEGMRVVARQHIEFGDDLVGASDKVKFQALDEIFSAVVEHYLCPHADGLALSLSTGFDSRYGLALAGSAGLDVPCHTFGDPGSLEVFGARRVAARVGKTTEVLPIPDADWIGWRNLIGLAGNCGTVQWCGWSDAWGRHMARQARGVMIGYLGDCLSGVRLNFDSGAEDWLARYAAAWGQWDITRPDAAPATVARRWRIQGMDVVRSMASECLASFTFAQAHQQAHCLNLIGRHRRHVSSQANLLSHFLTPLTYLYDATLLDFCARLPARDLTAQRLYLAYAHSRFPHLFPAKREQITYSISERVINKLRSLRRGAHSSPRPPVIDRSRIIIPNRERILALATRHGDALSPLIDVAQFRDSVMAYDGSQGGASARIIMTTNLLHLLDSATG